MKLTPKEIRRHTVYAVQALRSNYLRLELKTPFRQAAFLIAASEDFQRFIFAGDFNSAKCPGKSKLHDFALLVPDDFIRKINESLLKDFSSDAAEQYGLCSPLESKTLWLDATCLMSNIHFPVDWVLLRDAVRSLVKAILCIRRHGLKNRIPAPASFLSQINALCMEMSNSRRRQDAEKRRKDVLRRMKKNCLRQLSRPIGGSSVVKNLKLMKRHSAFMMTLLQPSSVANPARKSNSAMSC